MSEFSKGLALNHYLAGTVEKTLCIYIVIWLEYHGNRLYSVIGLLSKKLDGWKDELVGLDCYGY